MFKHHSLLTIFLSLILGAFISGAIYAETLVYKEITAGKEFTQENVISKIENGYLVKTMEVTKDEMTYVTDSSFSVIKWKYNNPEKGTDITAERSGNTISITGQFKNKKHEDKLKIDDSPWYQDWGLGLKAFIVSDKNSTYYWTINPADLKIAKMEVNKEKAEAIEVNGKKIESVCVKLNFMGFLKLFWSGNMCFRKSDGIYIFSKMKQGPPNVPETTVQLIEEK